MRLLGMLLAKDAPAEESGSDADNLGVLEDGEDEDAATDEPGDACAQAARSRTATATCGGNSALLTHSWPREARHAAMAA